MAKIKGYLWDECVIITYSLICNAEIVFWIDL